MIISTFLIYPFPCFPLLPLSLHPITTTLHLLESLVRIRLCCFAFSFLFAYLQLPDSITTKEEESDAGGGGPGAVVNEGTTSS